MSAFLLILAVLVLVALNGFFVAAEFALVRSRRSRVEALEQEGRKAASVVVHQMDEINEYLSSCQVGITLTSIGIGFLGEVAIAGMLENPLGSFLSHTVAVVIAVVLAYLIATSLHITLGEQVPKIYSIVHPEQVALRVARPLEWFRIGAKPLILTLNSISNGILRALGVNPKAEFDEASTSDDLKLVIAKSVHGGTLDPGEATMLSGVFHLHEQEARQVMTPIPAVVTVDGSETVETALGRCVESGHTRLVVTEDGDTDKIRGTVHNNSLARLLMNQGREASIEPIVKDAFIVPETRSLDDLLADLQRERASLAIVVDEYGRTAGIVSVEDIIEEIVGEIADETDPAAAGVRRLANGDWYARGHVAINDLADYGIALEADSDAYNSVGGFVFNELGRLPKRGDMVLAGGYSLRVESVRGNRIEAVRIRDDEPHRRDSKEIAPPGDPGKDQREESVRNPD